MKRPDQRYDRGEFLRLGAATGAGLVLTARGAFAAPPATSVAPHEALRRLKAGNARFVANTLSQQNAVTERRLALTGHQAPFASILSCSDSRVPPELIFDQNVGDLFVYRDAGNFVQSAALGTLEYGYANLGVKLIVVLGHEACGAVKATYGAIADAKPLPPNLDVIEKAIAPGITAVVEAHGSEHDAVVANAKAQAKRLSESSVLRTAIAGGDLQVVAAAYDFHTGVVTLV